MQYYCVVVNSKEIDNTATILYTIVLYTTIV